MPTELWIIGGGLIVLAICVWRIAVWARRHPGAVARQLPPPRYRRVQLVLFSCTCLVLAALLGALIVWRDLPFGIALTGVCAVLLLLELGRRIVTARLWRCRSCDRALPARIRRSGTNPANATTCPNCGEWVAH